MPDSNGGATRCTLCGREVPREPDGDGRPYCSPGCRDVDETLDPVDEPADGADAGPEDGTVPEDRRTFLRVDGMHSATDEAYLESRATATDGVEDATASYVTETIRVTHDGSVDDDALRDELSTLGYDAYLRTDADAGGQEATVRSREMSGMRKRRADQFLNLRYAAGVLFGAFLLLPYVILVYPAHLAELVPVGPLAVFRDAFQLEGAAGLAFGRIYLVMTGFVLLFTGMPVLRGAYASIRTRRPNTDLLVAITVLAAYGYSAASIVAGGNDVFFDLTLVVASAVTGAVLYETSIKQRALERLTDLTVSQVDDARRYYEADDIAEVVPVEELAAGDHVLVREGERVPVDGTLASRVCTVDESVVTGESVPVRKQHGDEVVGGSVVTDGAAVVTVGEDRTSGIDRITRAVWNVQSTDHGVQRRADRLAARVAPALGVAAVLAGVGGAVLTDATAVNGSLAALGVLLVGCPWALGLATPLSVAASIREALERGIVVFDETIFERLRAVDAVVFDKTGTLTTGRMEVLEADAPDDLLADVAALERRASHPAADAVVAAFGSGGDATEPTDDGSAGGDDRLADGGVQDDADADSDAIDAGDAGDRGAEERDDRVSEFRSTDAGVIGVVDGRTVAAGSLDLFAAADWTVDDEIEASADAARGFGRLPVVVGSDGRAEGLVVVGDEPRSGWEETLSRLADRGVAVVVLTGDDREATDFFSRHDAVEHVFAGVPPAGKTEAIRRLSEDREVAMVGDGTNDAPALAAADLGISMGSGTALAADAADLALARDDLAAVETAFEVASSARDRVRENEALALVYNAVAIPAALAGVLNPVTAMAAVVLAGGAIGINSVRSRGESDDA